MEIKEFAELILFGTNIASDKLLNPNILTDNKYYPAIIAPKEPGRPRGLKFNENLLTKKIPFPNKHQLEDERQRGYVLHFFANPKNPAKKFDIFKSSSVLLDTSFLRLLHRDVYVSESNHCHFNLRLNLFFCKC